LAIVAGGSQIVSFVTRGVRGLSHANGASENALRRVGPVPGSDFVGPVVRTDWPPPRIGS
jgi:hypothetical protein